MGIMTGKIAPGLVYRKGARNGPPISYWIARKDLVRAGYLPKTVRLHYAPDDPMLAQRCRVLQAEMLDWAGDHGRGRPTLYDGTFASLVRFYETHPDSPFHDLSPSTRHTYSKTLALLMRHKGERRVDKVDAADVRRWYKELVEANSKGWAYYTISVLKAVLSFGATKRLTECRLLRAELREARFHGGPRRKEFLTYVQVCAFREAAHAAGCGWMALCLTLQFDFGLRRRDVIGEWVGAPGTDGVRNGGKIWRDGLTWAHIDAAGVLRKTVSKTRLTSEYEAAHMVSDYPSVVAELDLIPSERRIGPIVLNARGLPPTEAQCRAVFRRIARKAGIPDAVWNMDARAGANTEAYQAGASEEDAMALLTHSEAKTNRGYLRDLLEQSRRAAAKRVNSRKE